MKKIGIIILTLWAIANEAQVVSNIDWVKYFNPRNTTENSANAIDGNSNVYTAGYYTNSGTKDLVVLKYDSTGVLQWSYTYDNGGDDEAKAISVGPTGNVYVTGYSYQSSAGYDFYTIKLNSAGIVVWQKRYNLSNLNDMAIDIKLDEINGFVYIVGTADNGSNNNIVTIRYQESNGNQDWVHSFNGSANDDDSGVGLIISSNLSSLFVCGNSKNSSGDNDIIVYRVSSTGSSGWITTVDGTNNSNDRAEAIIRAGNNVAVCGMVNNTGTSEDYTTILLNSSNGSILWQQDYDYGGNETATSIVKDSTGNFCVTGLVQGTGLYQYHTLLYNPLGSLQWTNTENTFINSAYIEPRVVCDTIAHHFYISGTRKNANNDVSVYQITPTGNTTWRQNFPGTGNGNDAATGLLVNGIGVIYLSALCTSTASGFDITTIKISQTPVYIPVNYNFQTDTFSFSNLYYPNTNEILDTAGLIAKEVLYYTKFTYPNQYVLKDRVSFCEFHEKPTSANKDSLSRVDMVFLGSNPLSQTYPLCIQDKSYINYFMAHTGAAGKVNVKGAAFLMVPNIYPSIDLYYSSNGVGSKYYFVVKPGGNPAVIRMDFQGVASTNLSASNVLSINSQLGSWKFKKPDIYYVTFNPYTWAPSTNSVSGTNGWINLSGNMYGFNPGSGYGHNPLVIEFDMGKPTAILSSSLNCQWSTYVGGGNYDYCSYVKSNSNNDVFVTGVSASNNFPPAGLNVFQSSAGGSRDGFIDKYDQDGQRLWSTFVGGQEDDHTMSIDYSANGDLYIVGSSQSTLATFAKVGATNSLTPLGGTDFFILQISSNAQTKKWLTYYGGNNEDDFLRGKFDGNGNFFVVGRTISKNIPKIGSTPTYTANNNDVLSNKSEGLIAKFNPSSQLVWATYLGSSVVGTVTSADDGLFDLTFDSNNDLFVCGYANGEDFPLVSPPASTTFTHFPEPTIVDSDGTIARFSNSGQLKWSTFMGGSNPDALFGIAVKNGHLAVTGYCSNLGYPLLNSGNYYYSTNNATLSDAVLSIFNGNNTLIHSTRISGNNGTTGGDIKFGQTDEIYIAGHSNSTIFPSPLVQQPNVYVQGHNGLKDNFLFCIPTGSTNMIWATNMGGPNSESPFTNPVIDINNQNAIHFVGCTTSSTFAPLFSGIANLTYFDGTFNSVGDGHITKFYLYPINFITEIPQEVKKLAELSVYPNPTQSIINVKLKDTAERTFYYIYNTLGQKVQEGFIEGSKAEIELSELPQGVYILEMVQKDIKASVKFIKNGY